MVLQIVAAFFFYLVLLPALIHVILNLISCLKSKEKSHHLKTMPRPPTLPVIGHMYMLKDYESNVWDGFNAIRKKYGKIVSIKMGVHEMALVSDINLFREILLNQGHIFVDRPLFPRHDIIFGGNKENSLALCNWSAAHRDRRKMCKRGVIPSRLSMRQQLLEKISFKFIRQFTDSIGSAPSHTMDKQELLILTSDIFFKFLCSQEYSRTNNDYMTFIRIIDFIFHEMYMTYVIDLLPFVTRLGVASTFLKNLDSTTSEARNFVSDKIFFPRYQKHLANAMLEEEEDDDYLDSVVKESISKTTHMSMEDYLIGVTDLIAGSPAVANILMRALGSMAQDDKFQDLVFEEALRSDLDSKETMPNLPVALAALYEALRLASSPIVPHVAIENTAIDGYFVPKGTAILFNSFHINTCDELWEEPYRYNPARFLKLQDDGTYKFEAPKYFLPFSMGRRMCLGHRLVETISTIFISHLCLKYKIGVDNHELACKLLVPKGVVALDPEKECFKLILSKR